VRLYVKQTWPRQQQPKAVHLLQAPVVSPRPSRLRAGAQAPQHSGPHVAPTRNNANGEHGKIHQLGHPAEKIGPDTMYTP
jgi:hypothetical protein